MHISKKKILVLAAHPDDECFGCGGFIKKMSINNNIGVVSFTNGVGARNKNTKKHILQRKKSSESASKILGFRWIKQFDYPDNEMDRVSILEIVKDIEKIKKKFKPEIVLTHNFTDLNIDHRIVAEASLTAFRPEPNEYLETFLTFEVPSSTDFRILKKNKNFIPNYFVNIQEVVKHKIKAIKAYKGEYKKYPHSRSLNGINNLSKIRGNQCGLRNAEAFEIIRCVSKN